MTSSVSSVTGSVSMVAMYVAFEVDPKNVTENTSERYSGVSTVVRPSSTVGAACGRCDWCFRFVLDWGTVCEWMFVGYVGLGVGCMG